jgi:cardiolipin synthase
VLRDGVGAYPAMLKSISSAKEEILLEMYWFGADSVGLLFRAALVDRANDGVRICVIYDSIGSLETPDEFWEPLRRAGARVFEFSPVSPLQQRFRIDRVMKRDHRKLLVVDRCEAFTGGINIGEAWMPAAAPQSGWRDDAVQIRGPSADLVRIAFFEVWRRFARRTGRRALLARLSKSSSNLGFTNERLRILTNRVGRHPKHAIRRAYFERVRQAKSSIDISSAYFLPGPLFLRALREAVRRGVRVRLLVPKRSDILIVSLAMRSLYGRLIRAGVQIFEYGPRILHAKTGVFDGRYATVGSHNLDSMSLRFNLECNVFVDSPEIAGLMQERFEEDLSHAQPLDLRAWQNEPLWLRLLAWIAALFRSFL